VLSERAIGTAAAIAFHTSRMVRSCHAIGAAVAAVPSPESLVNWRRGSRCLFAAATVASAVVFIGT
jgi:hypothetical protein